MGHEGRGSEASRGRTWVSRAQSAMGGRDKWEGFPANSGWPHGRTRPGQVDGWARTAGREGRGPKEVMV